MPLLVTQRVSERVSRDFKPSQRAEAAYLLASLDLGRHDSQAGDERIHSAMLLIANGNVDRLLDAASLAETDWRDLLVTADLADDGWQEKVDRFLDGGGPRSSRDIQ
jgi:hypothetical protein